MPVFNIRRDVLNGSLAQVARWDGTTSPGPEFDIAGGYVVQDESTVRVQVLMDDDEVLDHFGGDRPDPGPPTALLTFLPAGAFMISGFPRWGRQVRIGGAAASTLTFHGQNVVGPLSHPSDLRSSKFREVSAEYRGLLAWAGLSAIKVSTMYNTDSKVKTAQIDLLEIPPLPSGRVRTGVRLDVQIRWEVGPGDVEQRTIRTALEMRCISSTPTDVAELITVLDDARLAAVLAYRGWIAADPGRPKLDLRNGATTAPGLVHWNARLAETPPAARPARLDGLPLFTLDDLGNARGLARWTQLCADNRRVIHPLLLLHRNGSTTVEEHLQSICAACAYLVGRFRRQKVRGWAAPAGSPNGEINVMYTMATRIGRPWNRFVGNNAKWIDLLWKAYLDTKHFRGISVDLDAARTLAMSAEILLTCVLLDTASGTKKVSRSYLAHHTVEELRSRLRTLTA